MKALLLATALCLFGSLFLPCAADARDLVKLMVSDIGDRRPRGCPSQWCACYMDLMLLQAGFAPLGSWRARDFATYGKKAKPMTIGSIMVMPNHVGIVSGMCGNGQVELVSGNYTNRVGRGCYSARRAIAWRLPVS